MRALFLTTSTFDTEKLISSFTSLGHQTEVVRYDVEGVDVAALAEHRRPDVMVYIGAVGSCHNEFVPTSDTLARANRAAPMVHICSDSADTPWWPLLEEYDAAKSFRLQVGIDGCWDSPLAELGVVDLTPMDPRYFATADWESRIYQGGFAGGEGWRGDLLNHLRDAGLLEVLGGYGTLRYEFICAFYTLCRFVPNDARTGTGAKRHVKGRFLEAALAGAVVVEAHDSPAMDWFEPGVDYLTWHTAEEAEQHIRSGSPACWAMGERLRQKVLANHTAKAFWDRTFKAMGL